MATFAPTATPKPSLPPGVTVVRDESANPTRVGFSSEIMVNGKTTTSYSRGSAVSFGRDSEYAAVDGVLTFGGSNYRNSFTFGIQTVTERRLHEAWSANIGAIGNWSGTGWTGQPLVVHWPAETLQWMNVSEDYKTAAEGLTEVIYPAMDGSIYFYELETGTKTRNPITSGVVQKGTACLDPRGYPLLFVGQGIPVANDEGNNAAYIRVYSLLDGSEIYKFGGFDWFGRRTWQAYDGSPMIANDTLVYAGENGVLYTSRLNATFDAATGALSFDPERLVKYRYEGGGYSRSDALGSRWFGVESSVAAFRNFLFFADNGGRLQCVDVNDMSLKYVVDLTDETDATVVVEESFEDGTVYLYTGSRVRSVNAEAGEGCGFSYVRKINGLTGAIVWEKKTACGVGTANDSGGLVGTPHVGRASSTVSDLVIYAFSLAVKTGQTGPATAASTETPAPDTAVPPEAAAAADTPAAAGIPAQGGRIVAYDKRTGEIIWALEQDEDYWASPVVIYDAYGKAYLLQCDRGGILTMYDAATGTMLTSLDLGSRIDSTPVVYNNMLVVGTRGKGGAGKPAKICCIKIS